MSGECRGQPRPSPGCKVGGQQDCASRAEQGVGGGALVALRLESPGLPATFSGLTALDVQAAYLPDGFRQLKASLHLSDCSCLLYCFKTEFPGREDQSPQIAALTFENLKVWAPSR